MDQWWHCNQSQVFTSTNSKRKSKIFWRLEIVNAADSDQGQYSCKVKNKYGELEKSVFLEIEEQGDEKEKNVELKQELNGLLKKQMKIFSVLAK